MAEAREVPEPPARETRRAPAPAGGGPLAPEQHVARGSPPPRVAEPRAREAAELTTERWRPRLAKLIRRQPLGAAGAVVVLALVVMALAAPWLAPHPPKDTTFDRLVAPSARFPMGTDHLGRDVFSRVVWGARLSLYVGLASVLFGVTFGALWGVVTGHLGGALDAATQRVVDSLMALPPIILALALMAALGQGINNVILALVILLTPTAARTIRATALGISARPWVEAARALGCPERRIVLRHVLPNCLATYIVLATTNVSYAIVVESALSFLGAGAPPDEPSWGGMLTAGTQVMGSAPWLIVFPGLAVSLTVLALNLFGDAIRDETDPRLRGGLADRAGA